MSVLRGIGRRKNLSGQRIKLLRLSKDPIISQEELSEQIKEMGVTLSADEVEQIERGQREIYDRELVAIAQYLETSPSWLVNEGDENNDFEAMYYRLFNRVTDAIFLLQKAQQEGEDMFIEAQ